MTGFTLIMALWFSACIGFIIGVFIPCLFRANDNHVSESFVKYLSARDQYLKDELKKVER